MKRLNIFLLFLLSMFCISCQKDTSDGKSIILLGKEDYIQPFQNMVPDSLLTVFLPQMGNVAEGLIPPNIEGEYEIDKEFVNSNYFDLFHAHEMYLKITNQHNRTAQVKLFEAGNIQFTDTVYIMGNGQYFTLYYPELRNVLVDSNTESSIVRNVIITGEKTEEGIQNLIFGTIIIEADSIYNPYVTNLTPGMYFIYKDGDGLSNNTDWFEEQDR